MPLLKKHHVPLLLDHPSDEELRRGLRSSAMQEVFQIPFTGEIFYNYDDFVSRLAFLRQPIFSCSVSGRHNITYEEALASEHTAVSVFDSFPMCYHAKTLQFIQYSQSSLNDLVDQVVEHFEGDFLTNEQVLVTVPTSKASVRCVVMERTPEERAQNVYRLARMKSGTIFNAEPKQIIRDRTLFSKTMIRRFIKESAARESYQNAPWVVKPSLASYYHIKKAMPADLLLHEERKHARMMQPTVVKSAGLTLTLKHSGGSYPDMGDELPKPAYPMEDLLLVDDVAMPSLYAIAKTPSISQHRGPPPPLHFTLASGLAPKWMSIALEVYLHLYTFGRTLRLSACPFDIWLNELGDPYHSDNEELDRASRRKREKSYLFEETLTTLLLMIARVKKGKATALTFVVPNQTAEGEEEEPPTEPVAPKEEENSDQEDREATPAINAPAAPTSSMVTMTESAHWWKGTEALLRGKDSGRKETYERTIERAYHELYFLQEQAGRPIPFPVESLYHLTLPDRLLLLHTLVKATYELSEMHDASEQCGDAYLLWRKQRREAQFALSALRKEELKTNADGEDAEDALQTEKNAKVQAQDDADMDAIAELENQLENDVLDRKTRLRIKEQIKEIKERMAQRHVAQTATLKRQRDKAMRKQQAQKSKFEEEESALLDQMDESDTQMWRWQAGLRREPLGVDRFGNRYWFFDGTGELGNTLDPKGKRQKGENPAVFGCIWVERFVEGEDRPANAVPAGGNYRWTRYTDTSEWDAAEWRSRADPAWRRECLWYEQRVMRDERKRERRSPPKETQGDEPMPEEDSGGEEDDERVKKDDLKHRTPQQYDPNEHLLIRQMRQMATEQQSPFSLPEDTRLWGYYNSMDQVEALMSWLNPRGRRELALKNKLETMMPLIESMMSEYQASASSAASSAHASHSFKLTLKQGAKQTEEPSREEEGEEVRTSSRRRAAAVAANESLGQMKKDQLQLEAEEKRKQSKAKPMRPEQPTRSTRHTVTAPTVQEDDELSDLSMGGDSDLEMSDFSSEEEKEDEAPNKGRRGAKAEPPKKKQKRPVKKSSSKKAATRPKSGRRPSAIESSPITSAPTSSASISPPSTPDATTSPAVSKPNGTKKRTSTRFHKAEYAGESWQNAFA